LTVPFPHSPNQVLSTEATQLETALFEVKRVIVGQDRAIERLFVCLLAQGHCLLEGVPGLAKTLAMETLARVYGGTFARIQFTPDLLPADIVGTRIYRARTEEFDVELGPVFANFVLADEINRAPAKVQSALLEVMAEHQVSIGGRTFAAPEPFLVLATQNPVEQEGVYPLPEAQRDRFLMKVTVGYPSPAEEFEIVTRMGVDPPVPRQVLDPAIVQRLQRAAKQVYVDRGVVDYAVSVVLATRDPERYGLPELAEFLDYGASPRASLGLVAAGRALALMRGRTYALPQDVFDVAPEILRHRLVLSYEAIAQGLHVDQITARILSTVPAPRVTPRQDRAEENPAYRSVRDAPGETATWSAPAGAPSPVMPPAVPGGPVPGVAPIGPVAGTANVDATGRAFVPPPPLPVFPVPDVDDRAPGVGGGQPGGVHLGTPPAWPAGTDDTAPAPGPAHSPIPAPAPAPGPAVAEDDPGSGDRQVSGS
jgi:MoxR-like ATPase